jgi:uncharacterized surface protein with fasciclin (FAS1) repeats
MNDITEAKSGTSPAKKNILETALEAETFKTLLAAVNTAGLEETLNSHGPFTVFAPNDEAFGKLPAGALDGLLKDKAKLTSILTYHVVAGRLTAKDLNDESVAKTEQDTDVAISEKDGVILINNAKILQTDIECTNGIIHVIDTVLMPK